MTELLAAVSNTDELRNAVFAGADAVSIHAAAGGFSADALREAARFCRVRGVFLRYAPETDSEDALADAVVNAAVCGVNAFLIDSPAQARLCRALAPDIAVHASERFGAYNQYVLRLCDALGITRAVLPRYIPRSEAALLIRQSPVGIEIPLFADGCLCPDGTCLLPVMALRRSACGQCPRPCAKPYGFGRRGEEYPLRAPALRRIGDAHDWSVLGAAALSVDGGAATAVGIDAAAAVLRDGICTEQISRKLAALSAEEPAASYFSEYCRVPVKFALLGQKNEPVQLAAIDEQGNRAIVSGEPPEEGGAPGSRRRWRELLASTDGTPYRFTELYDSVSDGLILNEDRLTALRRSALSKLTAMRGRIPDAALGTAPTETETVAQGTPVWTAAVRDVMQVTPELLALLPSVLYLPLSEFGKLPSFLAQLPPSVTPCVICPPILTAEEQSAAERKLRALRAEGVKEALCSDLGQYALLRRLDYSVRWDVARGVKNAGDARFLADGDFASAACALTLSLAQIHRMPKPLPLEAVVYGRVPLLVSQECIIRTRSGVCACDGATVRLTDRGGDGHPILADPGSCRNQVFSGKKLYLLDKQTELSRLGLWGLRLQFTTEHPSEVDMVLRRLRRAAPFDAVACTRGMYPRGIPDM